MRLILASNSPRRQELIKNITNNYLIKPSNFNEDKIVFTGDPSAYVMELSINKARSVSSDYKNDYVIGMDTVVFIDGTVLNKPKDEEEAFNMIKILQGRMHEVFTGFAIVNEEKEILINSFESTTVIFDELNDDEIKKYINNKDWMGKAGGYAIQGDASKFINSIAGDFLNVVGFPINRIYNELKKINFEF